MPEEAIVTTPVIPSDRSTSLPARADSATFDESWAALHNSQIWRSGPDGTYGAECNDATGYSYCESEILRGSNEAG